MKHKLIYILLTLIFFSQEKISAQIPRGTWIAGITLYGSKNLKVSDELGLNFRPRAAYALEKNLCLGLSLPMTYWNSNHSGDINPSLYLTRYFPHGNNAFGICVESGISYSHYFRKPEYRKVESVFFILSPSYNYLLSKNILAELALPIRYNKFIDDKNVSSSFVASLQFSLHLLILTQNEK